MFDLNISDVITTKKPHACKGNTFEILRVGADYKIKCLTCGKIILLDSETLQKRIKSVKNKIED
jgi:hypothetical protein